MNLIIGRNSFPDQGFGIDIWSATVIDIGISFPGGGWHAIGHNLLENVLVPCEIELRERDLTSQCS